MERLGKNFIKTPLDIQREAIKALMSDPNKEVEIPQLKKEELPKAFFPHEFVRNVMGASAGAGSGEFDIYRGCRNREIARQEYIQAKAKEEKLEQEFREKKLENLLVSEKKRAKKRVKRLKAKLKLKLKEQDQIDYKYKQDETEEDKEEEEIDLNEA